jgi:hypothetical protein
MLPVDFSRDSRTSWWESCAGLGVVAMLGALSRFFDAVGCQWQIAVTFPSMNE